MHNLLQLLLFSSACLPYITAKPISTSDLLASSRIITNSSKLLPQLPSLSEIHIPTDFTISPQRFPIPISAKGCYYNTIVALAGLAIEDFNGAVGPNPVVWHTPRFPSELIEFRQAADLNVERKYVIWGLFLGMLYVIENMGDNLEVTYFSLEWQGREIGGLAFGMTPERVGLIRKKYTSSHINGTGSPATLQALLSGPAHTGVAMSLANLTASSGSPVGKSQLSIDYFAFGTPINRISGVMTIAHALAETASFPADMHIMQTWSSHFGGVPCSFVTQPARPLRTQAPFYDVETLVLSLAQATEWLYENVEWRNLRMVVKLDQVAMGQSLLGRTAPV